MNQKQWDYFCKFKDDFKKKIEEWNQKVPDLKELQKQAAKEAKTPDYPFETPIVYNKDLDKLTVKDEIRLIVIGDNPGKDEQLLKNNRYLVGQAGKIADGFFKRHQELNVDFRKNVIILNKTPVHSAKTNQLKKMMTAGGEKVKDLIQESQNWMAEQTALLQINLSLLSQNGESKPELWLVGYGELKNKGFFTSYRDVLKRTYEMCYGGQANFSPWNNVYVFQHFSMNRFTIDLNDFINKNNLSQNQLIDNIHSLGNIHKAEIFEI